MKYGQYPFTSLPFYLFTFLRQRPTQPRWRISSFKAAGLDLFLQVCLREENRLLVNKTYHTKGDNGIKWQS